MSFHLSLYHPSPNYHISHLDTASQLINQKVLVLYFIVRTKAILKIKI